MRQPKELNTEDSIPEKNRLKKCIEVRQKQEKLLKALK